jgi:hypothetical protein
MSTQMNKDVSCPHCGAAVKTQMYPGIGAEENPELRAIVLDETLFDWKCPACGYEAQLVYPCLYHDKNLNYMVYVVPNGNDCAVASVDVEKEFPQFAGMGKRVVSSLAGLKEKILIFEAGLDDLAVELTKLALTDVAGQKHGTAVDSCWFCSMDEDAGRISFSFFLNGEQEPVVQSTRMDVYRKSLEIVENTGRPGGEFQAVDAGAAREVLRRYRGEGE